MKKNYVSAFNFALIWAVILIGFVSAFSQQSDILFDELSEELRPFDFSDRYYYENGVQPEFIVNRRNGMDRDSVRDTINDSRFRDVRIRSVFPAYNQDGKIIYWNFYGEVFKDKFRLDDVGERAVERAYFYPLYVFPSKADETDFRQAHIIDLHDSYFEKNLLGLSVQVIVEFTNRINTEEGRKEMAQMAKRNGFSYDGTPIIKTVFEIEDLTRRNLITQKIKGLDNPAEPSFAIAKVIQNPQRGAIAPDAFLLNDLGLKTEFNFTRQFECLQNDGQWCGR
jgi:hypothetical protein